MVCRVGSFVPIGIVLACCQFIDLRNIVCLKFGIYKEIVLMHDL